MIRPLPIHRSSRPTRRKFTAAYSYFMLGLAVLAGPAATMLAVPPPNDTCASALVIPPGGPFPYWTPVVDITDADTIADPPAPTCEFFSAESSRSTWYAFTPATTGTYIITTCADAPTDTTVEDTILAIYTSSGGCQGPFIEITDGCNDDFCGPTGYQSSLLPRLHAGVTYYLVVWQWDDAAPAPSNSSLQLMVNRYILPENDTCADALPVELNLPVTGTTVGAVNHYQLDNDACFQNIVPSAFSANGRDVVYRFTAPEDGLYNIKAYNYGLFGDLVLYAAPACQSGGFPVIVNNCLGAANRNPVSTAEAVVRVPLAANQEIFIFVDEQDVTDGSRFTLEVTPCREETEPNDTPATASPWQCGLIGFADPSRDVDYFSLGAPPAGSRIFALLDGESANLTDFDLRVVTETETLEFDNDNNDVAFADSSPNIAGTPATGEPTYLQIQFGSAGQVGPYALYAVVQPPPESAIPESEPNDTLPQADTSDLHYYRGALGGPSPSEDRDVFSIMAAAGDVIYLGLDADPNRDATPINARLELLDASGNILSAVNDFASLSSVATQPGSLYASVPHSPAESLMFRTHAAGTYFARVSIGTGTTGPIGAGDYLLSIAKNCSADFAYQAPRFYAVEITPGGGMLLRLEGAPSTSYRLQSAVSLPAWTDLDTVTTDAAGQVEYEDTTESRPRVRFYRAITP